MALSDHYRKRRDEIASEREKLAIERAQSSVQRLMDSDQFKLSALALPQSDMAVDAIITTTVKSVLDPVAQLTDTLHAKGFRSAEVRTLVHNLFNTYCAASYEGDPSKAVFEEMVGPVADYVAEHQELYNTFDPAMLRSQQYD